MFTIYNTNAKAVVIIFVPCNVKMMKVYTERILTLLLTRSLIKFVNPGRCVKGLSFYLLIQIAYF